MANETGWLIEHPDTSNGVQYLTLDPNTPDFWTTDNLAALRFARERDGKDFQNYFAPIEGGDGKVVEHAWVDNPRPES